MTSDSGSFKVGIEFKSVLAAISKQIYETPLAFLRENVQNAIDAVRIQALRDGAGSDAEEYRVDVVVSEKTCKIRDNGIGMSRDDLRQYFWTIGASGKRTEEARAAGCVGMFGIGGFANLGVCSALMVVSQTSEASTGTSTRLAEDDIEQATGIPNVLTSDSNEAGPRGTLVVGEFRVDANVNELYRYLSDFVRFAEEHIYFNGELISCKQESESAAGLEPIGKRGLWVEGDVSVEGQFMERSDHNLAARVSGLRIGDRAVRAVGVLRFEGGAIDLYKRGFKLCATKIGSYIGVSGRLDSDVFSPTAGRDSLDADSMALLSSIARCMERAAVDLVLESPERIAQHTRIFKYVRQRGLIEKMGVVSVRLGDGGEAYLQDIRGRAAGGVQVYFSTSSRTMVAEIMHARGHIVVVLPSDGQKKSAVRAYLQSYCSASALDGVVECKEIYQDLDRFDRVFLSELEATIESQYEVEDYELVPGALTEDVPVFAKTKSKGQLLITVDVRHAEVVKLRPLGISPLLQSMVSRFCREFLGSALRAKSAKFFGSGGINLDYLFKKRSELWVLLADDIEVQSRRTKKRQVVRSGDVHRVEVGAESTKSEPLVRKPKLIQIVGDEQTEELSGYYLRVPDRATRVFGDVVSECDNRGVVWAGNKILFVASDTITTAFHVEIRMEHIVLVQDADGEQILEGARELTKPIQELHGGLYIPIAPELEAVLVPQGDDEIRIEISCDLMDIRSARTWEAVGDEGEKPSETTPSE